MRGREPELVQQARAVLGHVPQRVVRRSPRAAQELGDRRRGTLHVRRASRVAVVEAHDVEAAIGERLAKVLVPAEHLRAEAHDQQRWLRRRLAERLEAERDPSADIAELF